MDEHNEILQGFKHFMEARKIFAKYEGKWFSGNDNHIGDIGEYWTMLYFKAREPKLAPKRNSSYDVELKDGSRLAIKTMSKWNKSGQGGPVKGINEQLWQYLVAIKLLDNLEVETFCIVPRDTLTKKVRDGAPFKWWPWLEDFKVQYKA